MITAVIYIKFGTQILDFHMTRKYGKWPANFIIDWLSTKIALDPLNSDNRPI